MALADHARRFASGLRERDRARVVGRTLMRAPGEMEFIAPELPQKFGRHLVRTHRNATCASGWLGTGDQARIDARGCIRIRARGKDAVIRGGENSAVSEIESPLYRHPAVAQVAIGAGERLRGMRREESP